MWRQQDMPAPAAGAAERSEAPLICFTVFAPAAAGASLFALPLGGGRALAAVVVLMVTAGMLASIAHLARPLRAPRSLAHLGSSWLSREILVVSAFWALAVLWLVCELGGAGVFGGAAGAAAVSSAAGEPAIEAFAAGGGAAGAAAAATVFPWTAAARGFHVAAVVAGAILLWVIARAYRVHGQPAWDGSDTLWELVAGALGSGGAVAAAVAAGQGIAMGGTFCPGSIFGCCSAVTLGLVAILAISAACLVMGFAHRRRAARIAAIAEMEGGPRARAARDELAKGDAEPHAYLVLDSLAGACALAAFAAAFLLGGDAMGDLLAAVALALCAILELAAQASIRNRFYSLAQRVRFAASPRR